MTPPTRNCSRLLALVLVAVLFGVANVSIGTVSASVTAAAGAPFVDPQQVCMELGEDGSAVTAVTPAAPESPINGGQAYYAGTTLAVVFCNSEGEAVTVRGWDLNEPPDDEGFSVENTDQRYVVITMSGQNTTVRLAERVSRRDPKNSLEITVTNGAVVSSQLRGIDQINFTSDQLNQEYSRAEKEFLQDIATVNSATSEVNGTAARIRKQGISEANSTTVEALIAARSRLRNTSTEDKAYETLRLLLYNATFDGTTGPAALNRVSELRQNAIRRANDTLINYSEAQQARVRKHRSDVTNTILIWMAPGIVFGAVTSVMITYRQKRKTDYDRRFTTTSGRSRLLWILVAVGLLALVAGVIVLSLSVPTGVYLVIVP